jgi:hypothetical protein
MVRCCAVIRPSEAIPVFIRYVRALRQGSKLNSSSREA